MRGDGQEFDIAAAVVELPDFAALSFGDGETGVAFFLAQRELFAVGSDDISPPGVLIEAENFGAGRNVEVEGSGIRAAAFKRRVKTDRQTGGELTGALERLAGLIRERLRIARKLYAITAMGRMQAWMIGAMPYVLLIGLNYVAPSLLEGLFDSIVGYAMLAGVTLLVICGFLVIRKITTIDI